VRNLLCTLGAFACVVAGSLSMAGGSFPSAARLGQSINEAQLIRLPGNTRPEAIPENDRGLVSDSLPMEHMMLLLRRSTKQQRALDVFTAQLTTPGSPHFHQWLTAEEFGSRYGLAQQDLDFVTSWLQSHGFIINQVYPSRVMIDFSGNAGQVREAFKTEIHNLEVKGVAHVANMSDPQIPAALAGLIEGVVSLHDFRPHQNYKPRPAYTVTTSSGTLYTVVPADLATIYNFNPLFTAGISGQGQTIVLIEDTNLFTTADWTTFRSTFGLSGYTSGSITQVQPCACTNPGVNSDDGEAVIDVEWASAAAPSATIELASCASTLTTFGGLTALQNLINGSNPPAIMSVSYGECEAFNGSSANAAYNSAYQQAATEGVSVFVSTGDGGAAVCDDNALEATHGIGVSGFASSIYDVAVGGTDFADTVDGENSLYWNTTNGSTFGSAKSYIPEIPWNDSCASVLLSTFVTGSGITYGSTGFCNSTVGEEFFLTTAAGSGGPSGCATGTPAISGVVGGSCAGYAKPSWQSGLFGNPSDGVRDTPDVSLFAANGVWNHFYVFCFSDVNDGGAPCTGDPSNWNGAGGTSFAAPIMAGIQSLVNQSTAARQGNPSPRYYQLAAVEYGASGSSACNSTLGTGTASTCIFYDVTQGDMDVNCTGTSNCYLPSGANGVLSTSNSSYLPAYGTKVGWDFATGIGTVNANNLVTEWNNINGSPLVSLNPTSLTFAAQTVGTSSPQQPVTLTNSGTGTLTLNSVTITGTDPSDFIPANKCSASIPAGTSCLIYVTFKPTVAGTRTASLTLTDSAMNSPQNVPLTGTGTTGTPVVTLSPTSLSFSAQSVGTSSPQQTVTLTNTGAATLTLNSVKTTGTDPSDFIPANKCAASIPPATSCSILVAF
jgi:subtilase family serine protease